MKKFMNAFLMAAAVTLLAIGCKGKDAASSGDPRTVLIAFFERMAKKDIEGATKLTTKDSKSTMDMMKKGIEMSEKMKDNPMAKSDPSLKQDDPMEGFKNIEFGEAKIMGDDATVGFKNLKKGESFDFPLKKEDGGWKVDFSMSTLMKMGMEQRNKNSDLDSAFRNNPISLDSLKNGMHMLDSVMKNMDPEKMKKMQEAMKELQKMKTN